MQVNLSLTPGYRLKITRASRMSELVDRTITGLAALGGSAAFLEVLRRWLQRRQEKRQEQLQLDVRIMEEGHALRQEAYQREREALKALAEERERRHKAELLALEAQMQAKLEALTRANEALSGDLDRTNALLGCLQDKPQP
ncbi:MAG TPA: DUF1168 domain-containing protein [Thermoanaerobaculia bacterium]|nr:DUF1168 domain-containing protein [Thermoanaerobaculia bacterium]